jgi:hypothetical protein
MISCRLQAEMQSQINQLKPQLSNSIAQLQGAQQHGPGYGHYEVGGILRFFRDRYYPNAPEATGAQNDTTAGGGLSLSARFPVTRKADFGVHLVAGDGTGRYGASILPDVTVHPNWTLEPLRNAQALSLLSFIRRSDSTSSAMPVQNTFSVLTT